MSERREYPLIHPNAFDAKVVVLSNGKITNDGVRNPYPSPAYAHAHAEALLEAIGDLEARQ